MFRTSIYAMLLAALIGAAFVSVAAAQDDAQTASASTLDATSAAPADDETAFHSRTAEQYRSSYLKATNEATIDAIICQQIVQELRESGDNRSDLDYCNMLDTEEYKLERQRRLDYWRGERAKAKDASTQVNFKKFAPFVGAIVAILIVILLVGARSTKKEEEAKEAK